MAATRLTRLLPKLTTATARASISSSSPSLKRLFSSASPPPPSSDVISSTAADVADLGHEKDDVPVYSTPTPASVATPVIPNLLQPRVVVYDGVCHLCHGGVKWVIKADKYRKIKFCCVQSETAEPYLRLCGLDREDVLRRFLFVEGPGQYHQGSTAALKVLSYLPLPYSALSAFMVIPLPLREMVYDYVAKRRYDFFGKSEDCLVLQETELLERFIDREDIMGRGRTDL